MNSPRTYGPFSSSHSSHSALNSFISQGLMAPYCCPPGKLMARRLSNLRGPMPLSYLEMSCDGTGTYKVELFHDTAMVRNQDYNSNHTFSMGIAAINSNWTFFILGVISSIMANCPASVLRSGLLANTLSPVSASVMNPYTPTFSKSYDIPAYRHQ